MASPTPEADLAPATLATSGVPVPGGAPAPASAPAAPLGVLPAAPSPTGDDDHLALSTIQGRLAEAATRCYPRAAQRLGLSGETTVRFCIDEAGAPNTFSIRSSSGQDLLDRAARECVIEQAAPFPPLHRCLTVPVRFELGTR